MFFISTWDVSESQENKANINAVHLFDLPLTDDLVNAEAACTYAKNDQGLVVISFNVEYSDKHNFAQPNVITLAVLPEGYRPIAVTPFVVAGMRKSSTMPGLYATAIGGYVNDRGEIRIHNMLEDVWRVGGSICFVSTVS